jgi:hypothetical protein
MKLPADIPRRGRIAELIHLARCERGLSEAYLERRLGRGAALHEAHARLLESRAVALGGRVEGGSDDDWVLRTPRGEDPLRAGEYEAIATFHDHLTDLDPETAALVRERVLPEHEQALAQLDANRDHASEV